MITATMSPLAELMTRAGASDTDRPAWLAERKGGVTATEVRELFRRGPAYFPRLIEEKLSAELAPFVRNRYTEWGNKREPILAEAVRARYAIEPESRVFHHGVHPRHLASPDGVGEDFDGGILVSEIKTGKDVLALDGVACREKGYDAQMTWVMYVTGARRCRYVWEQHDSDWQDRGGEFEEPNPLPAVFEEYEYDEAFAAELVGIADAFLVALDAERARRAADDYVEPVIDEETDTLAVNLLRFRIEENSAKASKEATWKALLERVEGCDAFSQESTLARVTWSPGVPTEDEVPDVEAARAADPALYAELDAVQVRVVEHQKKFTRTSVGMSKPNLTVTAVKPKKETKK